MLGHKYYWRPVRQKTIDELKSKYAVDEHVAIRMLYNGKSPPCPVKE
jgi:hypothetical protein